MVLLSRVFYTVLVLTFQVIEAIIKSENKERAVDVLECAYNVMDDGFNKAHIAQTIARIYRDWDGMWKRARKWAHNAVEQAPKNFAIRDTLGRVYLSKQL